MEKQIVLPDLPKLNVASLHNLPNFNVPSMSNLPKPNVASINHLSKSNVPPINHLPKTNIPPMKNLSISLPLPKFKDQYHIDNLNEEQRRTLELFQDGKNIFLTGQAGTGKSYTLKLLCAWCKEEGITYAITSTTGISALLINGMTIHSWAGIGLGTDDRDQLVIRIRKNPRAVKRWCNVEVLIIDEVSMLSPSLFEKLNYIAQRLRHSDEIFGGIQIVLTGDFLQLPPIGSGFVFTSPLWNLAMPHIINLNQNMRQADPIFSSLLSEIRMGIVTQNTVDVLKSRLNVPVNNNGVEPTQLYSHRETVESINIESLCKLIRQGNKLWKYKSNDEIKTTRRLDKEYIEQYANRLDKTCQGKKELELSVGAQVMLIVNMDLNAGLCNGSRGVITRFENNVPVVKFINGLEIPISYHSWEMKVDDDISVFRTQLPLMLAWALTIHKSQGATLDCVSVDVGSTIFEDGQAYVALSRVKSLDGLTITDLDWKKIRANCEAKSFYDKLDHKKNIKNDHVRYLENVIPSSMDIYNELKKSISWQTLKWEKTGNLLPRLCFHSIQNTDIGGKICDWLIQFMKLCLNTNITIFDVFSNNYRNGSDYLPYHSDNYTFGNHKLHVISLSFGATRFFNFNTNGILCKDPTLISPSFYLKSGDIVIFDDYMNENYKHGIPKQYGLEDGRINLTCFVTFDGDPYTSDLIKDNIPHLYI
jgi:ATP-dependent DNA helicase PIF1